MSILLTGATGLIGSRVAAALRGRDDVRALARSDAAATKLGDLDVQVVRGDLDDPSSLTAAFAGVERIFLLTPFNERQAEQEHVALDAALQAGVTGVVYLSLIATDLDIAFARPHAEIEARLAASPLESTALRPDFFAQNLHGQVDLIRQGQLIFPAGHAALAPIDVQDIADAAVTALTADQQPTGTYTLTGPERLTFNQIADQVAAAVGHDVTYLDAPRDAWRDSLLDAGVPARQTNGLVEMFDIYKQTGGTWVTGGVQKLTGHAPRTLAQFLASELTPALQTAS